MYKYYKERFYAQEKLIKGIASLKNINRIIEKIRRNHLLPLILWGIWRLLFIIKSLIKLTRL